MGCTCPNKVHEDHAETNRLTLTGAPVQLSCAG
jgi:hypothetical protein